MKWILATSSHCKTAGRAPRNGAATAPPRSSGRSRRRGRVAGRCSGTVRRTRARACRRFRRSRASTNSRKWLRLAVGSSPPRRGSRSRRPASSRRSRAPVSPAGPCALFTRLASTLRSKCAPMSTTRFTSCGPRAKSYFSRTLLGFEAVGEPKVLAAIQPAVRLAWRGSLHEHVAGGRGGGQHRRARELASVQGCSVHTPAIRTRASARTARCAGRPRPRSVRSARAC